MKRFSLLTLLVSVCFGVSLFVATIAVGQESAPTEAADAPTLHVGMAKMFYLRNGNTFQGTIRDIGAGAVVKLETEDGTLSIPAHDFLIETATITKNTGTRYRGEVLSEDAVSFTLLTEYGEIVVDKPDIRTMDRYLGGKEVALREERQRFFQGEETLTHIFLDPTGFGLPERAFYVSGLSIGFGFADNFMLTTRIFDSVQGDINLAPHFVVFSRKQGSSELAFGVGGRLSTRHDMRREYDRYSHFVDYAGKSLEDTPNDDPTRDVENHLVESDEHANTSVFGEVYGVVSWRDAIRSGRGKWGLHVGAKTNTLAIQKKPDLKADSEWRSFIPYRVWVALDYDMAKRVKFLVEVFADNGWRYVKFEDAANDYFDNESPGVISFAAGDYRPVDIDLGFLVAPTDSFRIGLHFQNPYVTFYWKMLQF